MSYFTDHGLDLTPQQEAQFEKLFELFTDWNSKINLSAIRDREGIYLKHFVDSLLATKHVDFSGKKIADLGTGGGFPCLPLAIMHPDSTIHGFDSVGKKLKAVQDMADQLELGIKTFHGRLEMFGQKPSFRAQYDLVTTRALAPWETLMEYALPFVKEGGFLIAYQGPSILEDLQSTGDACEILGGEIVEIWEERLHQFPLAKGDEARSDSGGFMEERVIIQIEKVKNTPKKYPREVGMPKSNPLR
ncbi:MAG TPA: 16S rRNA (guanine(527)-N(7))-methyltransferase RsmG [Candidatus Gracilibacteria bacterium]